MIGILVCQPQAVLDHKLRDGKHEYGNYCYWELKRVPSRIIDAINQGGHYGVSEPARVPDEVYEAMMKDGQDVTDLDIRLYFAVKGQVQGYFKIMALSDIKHISSRELRFFSDDWIQIGNGKRIRPSQGWRYFDDEEESRD